MIDDDDDRSMMMMMEEEKNGERLLFDDAPGHFYISNTHRTTSLSRRAEARRNHRNFAHGHYVFSDHQEQAGETSCGFSEL